MFSIITDSVVKSLAVGEKPTLLERCVQFLVSREFGTILLLILALLLYAFELDIPEEHMTMLLASCALLLVSYGLERSLVNITNQTWPDGQTWYNSRRFGMVVLGFVFAVSNHFLDTDFANYIVQAALAVFSFAGLFSFTLQDLGEVINPPRPE